MLLTAIYSGYVDEIYKLFLEFSHAIKYPRYIQENIITYTHVMQFRLLSVQSSWSLIMPITLPAYMGMNIDSALDIKIAKGGMQCINYQ